MKIILNENLILVESPKVIQGLRMDILIDRLTFDCSVWKIEKN